MLELIPLEMHQNYAANYGDHTTATVVGVDEVISWGGRVEIVATVPGYSTSDTIARMRTPAAHEPATAHR